MRIDGGGIAAQHIAHAIGDVAHLLRVLPHDAELHREADRRPEIETIDAHPRLGQRALGDGGLDFLLDPLAGGQVLGDDDDLGIGLVRQLRIEAQPEARRALADIGGEGRDVPIAIDDLLGLFHRLQRGSDRRALGHADLEKQLRPLRNRKELLRHGGDEGGAGRHHQAEDGSDHQALVIDRPRDHPPQRAIGAGFINGVRIGFLFALGRIGQKHEPQIWRENNSHQP